MKQLSTEFIGQLQTEYKNTYCYYSPSKQIQKTLSKKYQNYQLPYYDNSISKETNYYKIEELQRKVSQLENQNQLLERKLQYTLEKVGMLTNDEYQQLNKQHTIQINKLMGEIGRLNDAFYELERMKKHEINRIKEDYEQFNYIQMSNLKQSQFSQKDIIQAQFKRTKELLNDKTDELKLLENDYTREKSFMQAQNGRLREQIRDLIQKKNQDYYEYQKKGDERVEAVCKQKDGKIAEMKDLCDQEINNIRRKLQKKQKQYGKLQNRKDEIENQQIKINEYLQKQKEEMYHRVEERIKEQEQRYDKLKKSLNSILQIQNEDEQKSMQVQMLEGQIDKLTKIIQAKDYHNQRRNIMYDSQILANKVECQNLRKEIVCFKEQLRISQQQHFQQEEILKVKMGVLHEGQIKDLVGSYETKLQNLRAEVTQGQDACDKLRVYLRQMLNEKYAMKKKYQNAICRLNEKVIRLRAGLNTLETEMKDKLDNDRSMMMITSRSLIKDIEVKTGNFKFQEEEIRKLRQLLDIQAKQTELSQKSVEEKINHAANQLNRLAQKILETKAENMENQSRLGQIIKDRENDIKVLNQHIAEINLTDKDNDVFTKYIDQLNGQLASKKKQLSVLKDNYYKLQKTLKLAKEQIQKLTLQNGVDQKQIKEQFKKISQLNLNNMKQFYQDRLKELENDKIDLKKLINSQYQKINELINKYKQLEQSMNLIMNQNNIKSQLQCKVILLGQQNNLVKNMAELFQQ